MVYGYWTWEGYCSSCVEWGTACVFTMSPGKLSRRQPLVMDVIMSYKVYVQARCQCRLK